MDSCTLLWLHVVKSKGIREYYTSKSMHIFICVVLKAEECKYVFVYCYSMHATNVRAAVTHLFCVCVFSRV